MFTGCSRLTTIPSTFTIPDLVTDCSSMFAGCSSLTAIPSTFTIPDLVTICSYMFSGCLSLTEIPSTFTIPGSVIDCSQMFYECSNLTTIQEGFTLGNSVINCCGMFYSCYNLTSDISNIWPSTWNSYTGTIDINNMFSGCSNIVGMVPADKLWNSGKTFISYGCFRYCTSLDNYAEIPDTWK